MPFPNRTIQAGDTLSKSIKSFSNISNGELIKEICCSSIPGWKDIDHECIQVTQIFSGLTNQLFVISILNKCIGSTLKHSRVLFRIYGKHVSKFYDSKVELDVFRYLSGINIAPKLIADFPEGRIEEFLEGEPLSTKQLQLTHICVDIARNLGSLHIINTKRSDFPDYFDKEPILFKRIKLWRDEANFQISKKNFPIDLQLYNFMLEEVNRIEDIILGSRKFNKKNMEILSSKSPMYSLVFAHNDLQENNLLQTSNNIRMIDYEYSAINFAAADIANFFCEFMYDYCQDKPPYFKVDFNNYPCEELRKLFISVYLSQVLQKQILPSHQIVEISINIVEIFTLVSHISWGFWSIARTPGYQPNSVEFDFASYTNVRFTHYIQKKNQLYEQKIIPVESWLFS